MWRYAPAVLIPDSAQCVDSLSKTPLTTASSKNSIAYLYHGSPHLNKIAGAVDVSLYMRRWSVGGIHEHAVYKKK